eukprot:3032456-Rhodomonas_salina.1
MVRGQLPPHHTASLSTGRALVDPLTDCDRLPPGRGRPRAVAVAQSASPTSDAIMMAPRLAGATALVQKEVLLPCAPAQPSTRHTHANYPASGREQSRGSRCPRPPCLRQKQRCQRMLCVAEGEDQASRGVGSRVVRRTALDRQARR